MPSGDAQVRSVAVSRAEVAELAHRWCENVRLAGCGWQAEGSGENLEVVGTGV